jgi:hypothetical protein
MPRQSIVGAASNGSFGFALASRPASITSDYLIAGGGGDIGGTISPGGGGAGQIRFLSSSISTKDSYTVIVGGITGTSSFNSQTAIAGGTGSGANGGTSAAGFGGGNGNSVVYPVIPGFPPWTAGGDGYAGGGGGGAAGGGGNGAARNTPDYFAQGGDGGAGVTWTVNGVVYGIGGGGIAVSISNTDGTQPISANGSGGTTFGSGRVQGGVIITYVFKTQLFTGGTVTSSGTFPNIRWTHTFSSSGTLAPAP